MASIAIIEPVEIATPLDAWIANGRDLAARRRNVDWELADWMLEGKQQGFLTQSGFDFLADNLGIGPAKLKLISKAAAIPAHLRDTSLTIEHHAHVAELPAQEQMELLTEAKRQHWSDDDLRKQAISRKVETGCAAMLSPDEWDDHCRANLQHAWNRASITVREEFAELIGESHMGVIDV